MQLCERSDADEMKRNLIGIYGVNINKLGLGKSIKPREIVYAFTRAAVRGKHIVIQAQWVHKANFKTSCKAIVFVRTRDGIYRTHIRTLRDFLFLMPGVFHLVNKSVVVNLDEVDDFELFRQTTKRLVFIVYIGGELPSIEAVVVSRGMLTGVKKRFAIEIRTCTT